MKVVALTLVLAAAFVGYSLAAQAPADSPVPVDVAVPISPVAVRGNGALHLFYELHLTNFRRQNVELTRLEIHADMADGPTLAAYSDKELTDLLVGPGVPETDSSDKRAIAGGMRTVAMLHLALKDQPAPRVFWHRLVFKIGDAGDQSEGVLAIGPVRTSSERALTIAPPLPSGDWLAANGPSDRSDHRLAMIVVNGKARIAQRFAVDWLKFGADGLLAHDDKSRNENWYGYGAEIFAVADGTVVATKDGNPENVPLSRRFAVPITLDTIAGNYITLDLGGGRFATFAHLQPGSLRANVGSKVRRGQVLGLLGNSGNSDAPHLHFQITDGSSALGSEGLPFVFEALQISGTISSQDELLNGSAWKPSPIISRKQEMPLENEVVRFP